MFSAEGKYLRQLGGLTSGAGENQFTSPRGVAIDADTGDLYVADTGNNRIQIFQAEGKFLRSFTAGVHGTLASPCSATLHNGIIYVADSANNQVQIIGDNAQQLFSQLD